MENGIEHKQEVTDRTEFYTKVKGCEHFHDDENDESIRV